MAPAHLISFVHSVQVVLQKPSWERRCPALAGRQTSISNSVGKPNAHGSRWMAEKMCFVEAWMCEVLGYNYVALQLNA